MWESAQGRAKNADAPAGRTALILLPWAGGQAGEPAFLISTSDDFGTDA